MQRAVILKIFYIISFSALIIGLGFYLYFSLVKADTSVGENGDIKFLDFGGNIGQKQMVLKVDGKNGTISVNQTMLSSCSQKIVGFEKSAKIDSLISIGEGFRVIEISGLVGAHSENRQYFYLDEKKCPQALAFVKNGSKVYNIYSDQPSFKLIDFNVDGWQDVGVEMRNYDADPIVDGMRDIYLYNPVAKEFVYSRSEDYKQEEVCPTCNSEIK